MRKRRHFQSFTETESSSLSQAVALFSMGRNKQTQLFPYHPLVLSERAVEHPEHFGDWTRSPGVRQFEHSTLSTTESRKFITTTTTGAVYGRSAETMNASAYTSGTTHWHNDELIGEKNFPNENKHNTANKKSSPTIGVANLQQLQPIHRNAHDYRGRRNLIRIWLSFQELRFAAALKGSLCMFGSWCGQYGARVSRHETLQIVGQSTKHCG
jgi:hypothetical protein